MARSAHRQLTYDDLLALPDDGLRHELIDGKHYVTAAPSFKHQRVSMNFSAALWAFVKAHDRGVLLAAPFDVVFSPRDVVEPDLLFVARERQGLFTAGYLSGAPDLVIEILSPSTRKVDEGIKRELYERMGVHEYWLANPVLETVRVYRLTGKVLRLVADLSAEAGDVLTTPLLPGLEIPLTAIFA